VKCCMKHGGSQSECCAAASSLIRSRPVCDSRRLQPTGNATSVNQSTNVSLMLTAFHVGCDCSWIAHDDCVHQDSCARGCRVANPWGPCGAGHTIQHVRDYDPNETPKQHRHHHHHHQHQTGHGQSHGTTTPAGCDTAYVCHGCSGEQCTLCEEEEQVKCCMKHGGSQSECCAAASSLIRSRPVCDSRRLQPTGNATSVNQSTNVSLMLIAFHVGCDCSWIAHDDCVHQDSCARGCRAANPWGPCGAGQAVQHVRDNDPNGMSQHHEKQAGSHHHHRHDQGGSRASHCNPEERCNTKIGCSPGIGCMTCFAAEKVNCCLEAGGSLGLCCSNAGPAIKQAPICLRR